MHAGWGIVAGAWLLVAASTAVGADDPAALRGRVLDAVSGAPVAGAVIAAGAARAETDAQGAFEILLPGGRGTLAIAAAGYVEQTYRVPPGPAPPSLLEITLVPKARFAESVDVQAAAPRPTSPDVLPVSAAQVMTVAGSLDNIFRVIQTLPGVVATDEVGSRLSVRGGSPDENLTIMDGVEIHNP